MTIVMKSPNQDNLYAAVVGSVIAGVVFVGVVVFAVIVNFVDAE